MGTVDIGEDLRTLRELLDRKDEIQNTLAECNKQIQSVQHRIAKHAEDVGIDSIKLDGVLSVSVRKELRVGYDKDRWDTLVEWAAKTNNTHIVQRRLSERPIKELMQTLGDEFPHHLFTLTEEQKVSTRRI